MTREEFDRQRAIAAGVEKWQSRILAAIIVPLGFAQLFFIRWLDKHVADPKRLRVEGSLFLAYIALVFYLLWRLVGVVRNARPKCPKCKTALTGMSERLAVTTGKCDHCGAELFTASVT